MGARCGVGARSAMNGPDTAVSTPQPAFLLLPQPSLVSRTPAAGSRTRAHRASGREFLDHFVGSVEQHLGDMRRDTVKLHAATHACLRIAQLVERSIEQAE